MELTQDIYKELEPLEIDGKLYYVEGECRFWLKDESSYGWETGTGPGFSIENEETLSISVREVIDLENGVAGPEVTDEYIRAEAESILVELAQEGIQ